MTAPIILPPGIRSVVTDDEATVKKLFAHLPDEPFNLKQAFFLPTIPAAVGQSCVLSVSVEQGGFFELEATVIRVLGDYSFDAIATPVGNDVPQKYRGQWRVKVDRLDFDVARPWLVTNMLRMPSPSTGQKPALPLGIKHGSHLDGGDWKVARHPFFFGNPPACGQTAVVGVALTNTMPSAEGAPVGWFLLEGNVSKVGKSEVELLMKPATVRPLKYEAEWRVVLRLDLSAVNPWVLHSMTRDGEGAQGGAS